MKATQRFYHSLKCPCIPLFDLFTETFHGKMVVVVLFLVPDTVVFSVVYCLHPFLSEYHIQWVHLLIFCYAISTPLGCLDSQSVVQNDYWQVCGMTFLSFFLELSSSSSELESANPAIILLANLAFFPFDHVGGTSLCFLDFGFCLFFFIFFILLFVGFWGFKR